MKKYILFGAGSYITKAIDLLGKENIVCILDNDSTKWETPIEGICVYAPAKGKEFTNNVSVIITVSSRYHQQIIHQLHQMGIKKIRTIQEIQTEITKKRIKNRTDYLKIYTRATEWITNNTIDNHAIICNSVTRKGYPEVTGYYIPTLLRWGYRDMAVSYATWLCEIQKENGSWYDTGNKAPYVFDTAQILKGLIAVRNLYPEVDSHILRGCDWILSNIQESGRLTTPTTEAWGDGRVCSELIHIYCLSPLVQAADALNRPEYREAAYHVLNYYKNNHYEEIMNFNLLSHFYAYVMEALLDMGEREMASGAMSRVAELQKESGAVPAYKDVDWVCSTGLFQFALVWFRLGDVENGNKAFEYACKLQNDSGGWYGSYLSEENPKEENDYFPDAEISWAVKYFLDALYYKNVAEFDRQAGSFLSTIDKKDGRYQILKNIVTAEHKSRQHPLKIADIGCGKGRYLKNLLEDDPENEYCAVDLSETVMEYITAEQIHRRQGSLTDIGYPDGYFDIVYTCEALEHAIDIKSAIKELTRVTKAGGRIVIIDKNRAELGRMEIDDWEVWFDAGELKSLLSEYCSGVEVIDQIDYEGKKADGLFLAWTGTAAGKSF